MSTATRDYKNGLIKDYVVDTSVIVTAGWAVKFSTTAGTVVNLGAGEDLGIGIALDSGTAGQRVRVLIPNPIVGVVVGTGGATEGKKAVWVADGFTDAPAHDSDGTTNDAIYGIFMETGIATNVVGLQMIFGNRGS